MSRKSRSRNQLVAATIAAAVGAGAATATSAGLMPAWWMRLMEAVMTSMMT